MDDIIEFLIEVFGELTGKLIERIKDPQKQKWAVTIFGSVICIGVVGCCTLLAIGFGKNGDRVSATVMGVISAVSSVLGGYFIVRGHRRGW